MLRRSRSGPPFATVRFYHRSATKVESAAEAPRGAPPPNNEPLSTYRTLADFSVRLRVGLAELLEGAYADFALLDETSLEENLVIRLVDRLRYFEDRRDVALALRVLGRSVRRYLLALDDVDCCSGGCIGLERDSLV